jgi:hypothetical protein
MRYDFKVVILNFLLAASALISHAQSDSVIVGFQAIASKETVLLRWTIEAGNTCNGIRIHRSADKTNFAEIGEISGVCGSTSEPVDYTFIDNSPVKNQVNYYRLEAGNTGFSRVVAVEIIAIGSEGYQVRPNPVSSETRIYFYNPGRQEHVLTLYNQNGKEVFAASTREDHFELNADMLQSGLYFFGISAEGNGAMTKGKLVVTH